MIKVDQEKPRGIIHSRLYIHGEGKRIPGLWLYGALKMDGFAVIRNAPIANATTDDERKRVTIEFLNSLPILGNPLRQNSQGDHTDIVRDEGVRILFDLKNRPRLGQQKGSKSNDRLGFHNDAAAEWHGNRINFVVLATFSQAPVGGDTRLLDAFDAYKILANENPDAAKTLRKTIFYFDRSSGYDQGQLPYTYGPIISLSPFRVRYTPRIDQGFETASQIISPKQRKALAAWDEVLGRDELHIKFKLLPKDVLILREDRILHARDSYVDDPKNQRTLVRLWTNGSINKHLVNI